MKNIETLITNLAVLAHAARFASLVYRSKEKRDAKGNVVDGGELARHTLILGFSYQNCLEKSILELELINLADFAKSHVMNLAVVEEAHAELLNSLRVSLETHRRGEQNPDYTKRGMYQAIVAGLNVNLNDGTFQLFGLAHAKVVLEKGIHKTINSSPKTLAKNTLRRELPIGKFREFALDADTIEAARLNGETLEFA